MKKNDAHPIYLFLHNRMLKKIVYFYIIKRILIVYFKSKIATPLERLKSWDNPIQYQYHKYLEKI